MSDILPVCLQDFLYSRKSELRKHKIRNQQALMMLGTYRQRSKKPLLAFCYIAYQELIRWINCDYIVYRSRRCCCARKEEGEQISDSSV